MLPVSKYLEKLAAWSALAASIAIVAAITFT
jgi:hypothetical protein